MKKDYELLKKQAIDLCDKILVTEEQRKEIIDFIIQYKQDTDLNNAFIYEPVLYKVEQFCKKWS